MDYLSEISEEFSTPFLPPIFGPSSSKHRKPRKQASKRPKKPKKPKILYDISLRSKASSVISSSPPGSLQSKYRTSRLTQLSNYSRIEKPCKSLRSNSNLSTIAKINQSQRFSFDTSHRASYEDSKFYIRSELHLPSINKSAILSVESSLCLSGNKKDLIERADYFRVVEEKKKESKEVALGTDLLTDSEKMSCGDPIDEFFDDRGRSNMRRSSFDSQRN